MLDIAIYCASRNKCCKKMLSYWRLCQNGPSIIAGLESKTVRPLWEGAQLFRVLAFLVRVELPEVYMPTGEGKTALSVRDNSMLLFVGVQSPRRERGPTPVKLTS